MMAYPDSKCAEYGIQLCSMQHLLCFEIYKCRRLHMSFSRGVCAVERVGTVLYENMQVWQHDIHLI